MLNKKEIDEWNDFVDTMDFARAKVTDEYVKTHEEVKPDVEGAVKSLVDAKFFLNETEGYESEILDEAYRNVTNAIELLKVFK